MPAKNPAKSVSRWGLCAGLRHHRHFPQVVDFPQKPHFLPLNHALAACGFTRIHARQCAIYAGFSPTIPRYSRTARDFMGQRMAYIRAVKGGFRVECERSGLRKSATFETRREAVDWGKRTDILLMDARADHGHTFAQAVAKYQAEVSSKKDGGPWEVRRLNAMLQHFPGNLADIEAPQIGKWRNKRLETVSGSTVVREVNLLRNLFNVARLEWHWIDHKPFEGVKLPKENAPRHQVWPWQLIKRVLRAPRTGKTAEMQDAFHIALRTGMRLAEVLQSPEHFDAKRRVVVIKTKTEARAEIPIGRIAAKLLQRQPFQVGPNEGSVLFGKLCRELLIDDLHFHDARGTALTLLAKKVDVLTLARISRHKDLRILMNVYYRATASDIARGL